MLQQTDNVLKRLGLFGVKRRLGLELRARGWLPWRALTDAEEFSAHCPAYIAALDGAAQPFGAYLEFGVSRGTSLAAMALALKDAGRHDTRLIGFDSFEGLPKEADAEGWQAGWFKSTEGATRRYLRDQGVDLGRVTLVKGWFEQTLTDATVARLALKNIGIVMIDCDIYSGAVLALSFVAPLLNDRAVIILDDWDHGERTGQPGEKEAFTEFMAAHPELTSEPMKSYKGARVFLVTKTARA